MAQDPASSAGLRLGTYSSPGMAPSRADNFREDFSWPRLWGRRKGVPREEKGDLDISTPAAGASPGSNLGAPQEMASTLPTSPCNSGRSEARDAGQLCVGSTRARARPSAGVQSPWMLSKEVAEPPGPLAGHSPGCPLEPSSVLLAPPPSGWPELVQSRTSESSGLCEPQCPFPSLRAEPQLTWCCLSSILPLPMEQKEKAMSVYWTLHCPRISAPAQGADVWPEKKAESGEWIGTSPAEGGETQPWKVTQICPGLKALPSGRTCHDGEV